MKHANSFFSFLLALGLSPFHSFVLVSLVFLFVFRSVRFLFLCSSLQLSARFFFGCLCRMATERHFSLLLFIGLLVVKRIEKQTLGKNKNENCKIMKKKNVQSVKITRKVKEKPNDDASRRRATIRKEAKWNCEWVTEKWVKCRTK